MKSLFQSIRWRSFIALLMFSFIQVVCWSQDSQSSSSSTSTKTTTTEHTEWYTAPWVWVVGGAVLILLLVAILSGGRSSSSRTTVTKTTDIGGTTRTITSDTDEV
jgi:hypothetical protein